MSTSVDASGRLSNGLFEPGILHIWMGGPLQWGPGSLHDPSLIVPARAVTPPCTASDPLGVRTCDLRARRSVL